LHVLIAVVQSGTFTDNCFVLSCVLVQSQTAYASTKNFLCHVFKIFGKLRKGYENLFFSVSSDTLTCRCLSVPLLVK